MVADQRKFNDCKPQDVIRLFSSLHDFEIDEGGKHTKVTHVKSGKTTTVPRHARVNPHIVRDIVNKYVIRDLGYDRQRVLTLLDC